MHYAFIASGTTLMDFLSIVFDKKYHAKLYYVIKGVIMKKTMAKTGYPYKKMRQHIQLKNIRGSIFAEQPLGANPTTAQLPRKA